MNYKTIVAFFAACLGREALAQDAAPTAIAVQQFAPAVGINPFFTIEGAKLLPKLELALGIYSHLSDDPLVARPTDGTTGGEIHLIESQFGFNATIGVGINERFELGFDLPITAFQRGESPAALNNPALPSDLKAGGLGDLRVIPKILLWRKEDKFSLIGAPILTLPTGDKNAFLGESLTFRPSLIAAYHLSSGPDLAANIAWKIRQPANISGTVVDDQFAIGLGAHVPLKTKTPLGAVAELASSIGNSSQTSPTEARVGLRAQLPHDLSVSGGLGTGLFTEGIGAPDIRVFASLIWVESGDADKDKDGIANKNDQCIDDPEDHDQFQDEDGCPDTDNDNDTVLDAVDGCPLVQGPEANKGCPIPDQDNDGLLDNADACPEKAEDKDNFQDEDGCPEDDNDQDKIVDSADKCPIEPEDVDQFEDEDGCPELDNDKDAVTDIFDKCPLVAEDKDQFEDEDGCPDADNDQDGISDLDGTDKCPNDKETFNGDNDADGCPDTAETAKLTGTKIEILEKVLFATNSDIIDPASYKLLDGVAALLKLHPEITKMRVEGHTDNKGVRTKNIDLSNRRAAAVVKYLTELSSIDAARLEYKGFGPDAPAQDNKTAEGRTANRRVEFVIIDKDGVRIAPPDPAPVETPIVIKKDPTKDPKKDPKKDPTKDPKKDPAKDPKKDPTGPKRR